MMSTVYEAELDQLETWVIKNSSWLALGIIVAAFALRLAYVNGCYLNPDEAQHFSFARPSSWHETYEASRVSTAHPPLFILVLHGMLFFGRSELILRMPSLIGGTVALWFTFAWLRRCFGEILAVAALLFLALSPAAISASTEVRQYGLLLCFVCCSLYATERMFSDRSVFWAITQGFFLLCALLTHYTTVVVLVSLGAYVLLRSWLEGVPRRMLFAIGVSQVVLGAVLAWLYFGQVRGTIVLGPVGMGYLQPYYYAEGHETPLGFVWRMLSRTFSYAVGFRPLAFLSISVFLAGFAAILAGRSKAQRHLAILILSPFVVGAAAAVFRVFPFAGSRHQTYLLPFLAAGISVALAWLRPRLAIGLLLVGAVIATPLRVIRGADNDRRLLPMADMTAAIEYVHRMVPQGTPLFVDYQTRYALEYYLARNDKNLDSFRSKEDEEWLGGYRVVVPKELVWTFSPDDAIEQVVESAQAVGVPPGDPIWIFSSAWVEESLASRLSNQRDRDTKEFGRISVIKTRRQDQPQTINSWPRIEGPRRAD